MDAASKAGPHPLGTSLWTTWLPECLSKNRPPSYWQERLPSLIKTSECIAHHQVSTCVAFQLAPIRGFSVSKTEYFLSSVSYGVYALNRYAHGTGRADARWPLIFPLLNRSLGTRLLPVERAKQETTRVVVPSLEGQHSSGPRF